MPNLPRPVHAKYCVYFNLHSNTVFYHEHAANFTMLISYPIPFSATALILRFPHKNTNVNVLKKKTSPCNIEITTKWFKAKNVTTKPNNNLITRPLSFSKNRFSSINYVTLRSKIFG